MTNITPSLFSLPYFFFFSVNVPSLMASSNFSSVLCLPHFLSHTQRALFFVSFHFSKGIKVKGPSFFRKTAFDTYKLDVLRFSAPRASSRFQPFSLPPRPLLAFDTSPLSTLPVIPLGFPHFFSSNLVSFSVSVEVVGESFANVKTFWCFDSCLPLDFFPNPSRVLRVSLVSLGDSFLMYLLPFDIEFPFPLYFFSGQTDNIN